MKPTVGRIVHFRDNGVLAAGIITEVDANADDTRNCRVHLSEVQLLGSAFEGQFVPGFLYDTEEESRKCRDSRVFFWPERTP